MNWNWLKKWAKRIACGWMKDNKKDIEGLFDEFTDNLMNKAKAKLYEKYPNLPDTTKAMIDEIFANTDNEFDAAFNEAFEKLIKELEE